MAFRLRNLFVVEPFAEVRDRLVQEAQGVQVLEAQVQEVPSVEAREVHWVFDAVAQEVHLAFGAVVQEVHWVSDADFQEVHLVFDAEVQEVHWVSDAVILVDHQ